MNFTHCPCCEHQNLEVITPENDVRVYAYCLQCGLIHAHPSFKVSFEEEKERYLEHNNSPNDKRYLNFLSRIVEPASKYLQPQMQGVDYGCGPGPALDHLLKMKQIDCTNYDPIFFPKFPEGTYDFVFSTECFEHFNETRLEIEKVLAILRPQGYLFVMTQIFHSTSRFMNWYYKRDQTHVSFFSIKTWHYLCEKYNLDLLYHDDKRVFILQKRAD